MINITYEQAQEMYAHLLAESVSNINTEYTRHDVGMYDCTNSPRGNVQARVTGIISVSEHFRIVEQSDKDIAFLSSKM